jgi:hypothetical protein
MGERQRGDKAFPWGWVLSVGCLGTGAAVVGYKLFRYVYIQRIRQSKLQQVNNKQHEAEGAVSNLY